MEQSAVRKPVEEKHPGMESTKNDETWDGMRTTDKGKFDHCKVQAACIDPSPPSSCVAEAEHDSDFLLK